MSSIEELKAIGAQCITTADDIKNILHQGEDKTTELVMMSAFLEGSSNEKVKTALDALGIVHQAFDAYYASLSLYQEAMQSYIKGL